MASYSNPLASVSQGDLDRWRTASKEIKTSKESKTSWLSKQIKSDNAFYSNSPAPTSEGSRRPSMDGMAMKASRFSKSLTGPKLSKEEKSRRRVQAQIESGQEIIQQYDETGSGSLKRQEVMKLLSDQNTWQGRPVSEDELNYVFKIADMDGDQRIKAHEMAALLSCWDNYKNRRKEIDEHFLKHDPSGTGRLNQNQLRSLLTEMNRGVRATDEELEWIMKQASQKFIITGPEYITKPELRRVLALWEDKQSQQGPCVSACSVQ